MKITPDEPVDDFPSKEKIQRRKHHRLKATKEDARKDLTDVSESSREVLKHQKKGLEETGIFRGD